MTEERKFCPNCGHEVSKDATFCNNCGYQFKNQQSIDDDQRYGERQQYRQEAKQEDPVNQYQPQGNQHRRHNKNNRGLIITIIVLVLVLAVFVGAFGYQKLFANNKKNTTEKIIEKTTNKNSAKNSQSSSDSDQSSDSTSSNSDQDISLNDANDTINDIFTSMADSVKGSDLDYSDDFTDGTGNKSYDQLVDWVNIQDKNDKIDSVSCTVQELSLKGNIAHFNVKYNFEQADSDSNHIQIFPWTAKLTKDDAENVKVISCQSSNKASSDYNE